jgi:hypothetical protein
MNSGILGCQYSQTGLTIAAFRPHLPDFLTALYRNMKSAIRRITTITAITTTAAVSVLATIIPSSAVGQFQQQEVQQGDFVAVAAPYQGGNAHQLLVIEQLSDTRPCWSESGSNPTIVTPLLLNFDFTGICARSTDSNGYSIRMANQDLGIDYSLRIVRRDNDMLLVGVPRTRGGEEIVIGRTGGVTSDFAKINLDPGWRFTKRQFENRVLGHVYLTSDTSPPPIAGPGRGPASPFRDVGNDVYANEINQAVALGFITGFENGTFRPTEPLTREQLVVMVLGAIDTLPNVNLTIPSQVASAPYSDVAANRWSAARIQFATANNIVTGYEDRTFRPTQPVTRAELIAVLRRAAEYARGLQGQPTQLQGNRPAQQFGDISRHWASDLITQMSTFCGVASPLNEQGSNFFPNSPAQRNYAAAATLRMLTCLGGGSQPPAASPSPSPSPSPARPRPARPRPTPSPSP